MSPYIQQAIVASEDSRFYDHHGVDIRGVARAFVANDQAGGVSQGASTLTMQYVRNALRDGADTPAGRAGRDRADERPQAPGDEAGAANSRSKMTKTQILEGYLNVAYFGHRAYGINAAADIYFSTTPDKLTLDQAAMIAGLVQAPTTYDPTGSDKAAALQRRNYVIDRMAGLGYISGTEAKAAEAAADPAEAEHAAERLRLGQRRRTTTGASSATSSRVVAGAARRSARPQDDRLDSLRAGRLEDRHLDRPEDPGDRADARCSHNESKNSKYALGEVLIEPGTGRVKAMAVNRTYSLDQNGQQAEQRRATNAS